MRNLQPSNIDIQIYTNMLLSVKIGLNILTGWFLNDISPTFPIFVSYDTIWFGMFLSTVHDY
jgi:hypothetical protein